MINKHMQERGLIAAHRTLAAATPSLTELVDSQDRIPFLEIVNEGPPAEVIPFPQPWHSYDLDRNTIDDLLGNMRKYTTDKQEGDDRLGYDDIREMLYKYKETKAPISEIIEGKNISKSTFYRILNKVIDAKVDPDLHTRIPKKYARMSPEQVYLRLDPTDLVELVVNKLAWERKTHRETGRWTNAFDDDSYRQVLNIFERRTGICSEAVKYTLRQLEGKEFKMTPADITELRQRFSGKETEDELEVLQLLKQRGTLTTEYDLLYLGKKVQLRPACKEPEETYRESPGFFGRMLRKVTGHPRLQYREKGSRHTRAMAANEMINRDTVHPISPTVAAVRKQRQFHSKLFRYSAMAATGLALIGASALYGLINGQFYHPTPADLKIPVASASRVPTINDEEHQLKLIQKAYERSQSNTEHLAPGLGSLFLLPGKHYIGSELARDGNIQNQSGAAK